MNARPKALIRLCGKMAIREKARHILVELKGHAPFTCVGALLGIIFMLLFRNVSETGSWRLFAIFHPAHVVLSAIVTTSMLKISFNIAFSLKEFLE